MSKFKKTAMIVTSIIMAGTMVFGFAACGGGGSSGGGTDDGGTSSGGTNDGSSTTATAGYLTTTSTTAANMVSVLKTYYNVSTRVTNNAAGWTTAKNYWTYLSSSIDGTVSSTGYSNKYNDDTDIGIAIGYQDTKTGAFYGSLDAQVTIPGGYTAQTGALKPAIYAIQEALNVQFTDYYSGEKTSANLTTLVSNKSWGNTVDICTSDISVAVSQANTNQNILNLANYLDQMPNFKAYLEENPVVYLSLLQSGWDTSDSSSSQTIYIAPYFDGNDDIERYCLIRQDWVEDLLDDNLLYDGDTYKAACADSTSVSGGWMGLTGSYEIETSTEEDKGVTTFTLTKDYDKALAAVKDTTTDLGAAYNAIASAAYTGASGNIVDIMNAAINANTSVTGKQLATLYRAYIDVAYLDEDGNSAYGETRSNLFNGYSAAWDVDDLVAMLRIVKTNSKNVGLASCTTEGIFPRDEDNQRSPDIIRLCAQLYGERGADSRYEYTYIDSNGELQDMRANESFYKALENFGALASEGLVYKYISSSGSLNEITLKEVKGDCVDYSGYGFMEYDYSQTQTTQMFDFDESSSPDTDYLFGAISTPVSKWDVDGDGTKEVTMRFTESWRSTKTGGLCVAANVANDTNLLNAVLAFIDYLYSNDGQILSTYGIQSTTGNTNPNGTWYGEAVSGVTTSSDGNSLVLNGEMVATKVGGQMVVTDNYASKYFCFGDTLYTGTLYKGSMTPTITTELYESFLYNKKDDTTYGKIYSTWSSARGSFTTYARQIIGATLPMGVKDQSFENQLTATAAAAEATKVSASLANDTIKHVTLEVNSDSYWYTTVPSGLPLTTSEQNNIDSGAQTNLKYMTGTSAGSNSFYSIFHYIIFFGYSGTYTQQGVSVVFSSTATYLPW